MADRPIKLDRRRRPISTLGRAGRQHVVEELLSVWNSHPQWGLGQLVAKAARIGAGEGASVERLTDDQLQAGLDAMIPMAWEVEDGHPAVDEAKVTYVDLGD